MSRKISIVQKRQWLQEYDSGISEYSLKNKHKNDIRTIKNGIEDARVDRDLNSAKVEMMKNVLLRHQGRLLERLNQYQESISVPQADFAVLSWYEGEGSVFSGKPADKKSEEPDDPVTAMLQQHLKDDKVWKLIKAWHEAYRANIEAREALQRRIFAILKMMGYPVVNASNACKPCLYADTVGPLFYRWVLYAAFSPEQAPDPEREIIAKDKLRAVMFRNSILVETPQNLEEARTKLIQAYEQVSRLAEVKKVMETQNTLKQMTDQTRRAIDEILLMDYIAGACRVCRHMSPS